MLGLRLEASLELDELGNGGMNPERYLAGSRQLATAGLFGHSVRAAQKAQANGAGPSRELTELLYPIPHRAVLITEADAAGLDPLLVASLIRQESAYDADARSVADARGLMQVLPTVGSAYARRLGIGEFDPVLLYQPDLNLHFGAEHLAEDIRRFGQVEHALAAYNAGVDRVERWLGMPGTKDDPELFVERIPFAETRDYVRRVLRNQGVYRSIYGTVGR